MKLFTLRFGSCGSALGFIFLLRLEPEYAQGPRDAPFQSYKILLGIWSMTSCLWAREGSLPSSDILFLRAFGILILMSHWTLFCYYRIRITKTVVTIIIPLWERSVSIAGSTPGLSCEHPLQHLSDLLLGWVWVVVVVFWSSLTALLP